jgi:hypothetical protein
MAIAVVSAQRALVDTYTTNATAGPTSVARTSERASSIRACRVEITIIQAQSTLVDGGAREPISSVS